MTTGLIRWNPHMDLFRDRMSRFFDEAFNDFVRPVSGEREELGRRAWAPAVDIRETADELVLAAEIPGLTKKDVEITVEDHTLTLSGERKLEKDVEKENYHRIERAYGRFSRVFTLPANVRTDQVKAEVKDGVLLIHLPKAEEAKPRRIEIR